MFLAKARLDKWFISKSEPIKEFETYYWRQAWHLVLKALKDGVVWL